MASLGDVFDGLKNRLGTIDGLYVHDHVPGTVVFPAALIHPPALEDYSDDLDEGSLSGDIDVAVLVSAADSANQRHLVPYIERTGPKSIYRAVEADRRLGLDGSVDAYVRSFRPLGLEQIAAYQAYGGLWTVRVTWDGVPL